MTKMQIISKAVLTGIGFYFIGLIMRTTQILFNTRYYRTDSLSIIGLVLCVIAIVLVILFRVVRNDKLARDIAGPGEILDNKEQKILLVISLRLSVVFTGLFLLAGSMGSIISLVHKLILFLPKTRDWISLIISSHSISDGLATLLAGPLIIFRDICLAALIIYLLAGAPHFVKWQIEHSVKNNRALERLDDE